MVQAEEARRLLQVGTRGHAMVMAVRDTGSTVGENPITELDLCVAVDGRDPYRVIHRQPIAKVAAGSLWPGAKVPVRVDPSNPHNVLVA
jgi:hypothetical protein